MPVIDGLRYKRPAAAAAAITAMAIATATITSGTSICDYPY
jgi:hypothetical protein